ncbi:MAG: sugar phosphate nucleotidyltransferase [Candidatus Bathyarchaeia archaeon]
MKTVLLAAGRGTRLYPITETRPKSLIPLLGKPLLSYTINSLEELHLNDFTLVVDKGRKESFQKALSAYVKPESKFTYVEQETPKGTAHAVSTVKDLLTSGPVLLVYGDIILKTSVIERILSVHENCKLNVMVAVASKSPSQDLGIVKFREDRLISIMEKPRLEPEALNYVNAGIYVFNEDFYPFLEDLKPSPRGEYELTDSINKYVASGGAVSVVKAEDNDWMHIGYPWDILDANERILKEMENRVEGELEDHVSVRGAIVMREGSVLKAGSVVEGPVYIGEEAAIGPNCFLRPYTAIGRRVKVGYGCEIKNSLVMNGSKISHLSYIGDSIIGENCNIGAGTITANLRFDESNIKMMIKEDYVNSARKKLGAVLGDRVKTGIHVCLMPGVKIGCDSIVGPNSLIYKDVPSRKFVMTKCEVNMVDL